MFCMQSTSTPATRSRRELPVFLFLYNMRNRKQLLSSRSRVNRGYQVTTSKSVQRDLRTDRERNISTFTQAAPLSPGKIAIGVHHSGSHLPFYAMNRHKFLTVTRFEGVSTVVREREQIEQKTKLPVKSTVYKLGSKSTI
ncbi:unnamed protein product [Euphydryas editha]|uniref:Uncharacterized protein n=1 Tax=Euphydryas editha TaxID=104508 RepID=A0AAU9TKL0_EUPED|nr:unnamed protein product [Euphydryas editha]